MRSTAGSKLIIRPVEDQAARVAALEAALRDCARRKGGVEGWRMVTQLEADNTRLQAETTRLRAANRRLRAKLKAVREAGERDAIRYRALRAEHCKMYGLFTVNDQGERGELGESLPMKPDSFDATIDTIIERSK